MSFSNYVNNLFMVKCMVFMHRWCCRDHANYYMSKLQFDKYALLSRKGFCWEYALLSQNGFRCKYAPFWVCLVQTFTQTFRIWLRFCADIWTKNRRLTALHGSSVRKLRTFYQLHSFFLLRITAVCYDSLPFHIIWKHMICFPKSTGLFSSVLQFWQIKSFPCLQV